MKIFISYHHNSSSECKLIAKYLENAGFKCWYAERDIIGEYADAIAEAVSTSDVMIVLLTDEAMESHGVKKEVEMMSNRMNSQKGLLIVPFLLTSNSLNGGLSYHLQSLHWINATISMDNALNELITKLKDYSPNSEYQKQPNKVDNFDAEQLPRHLRSNNRYISEIDDMDEENNRLEQESIALYPYEKKVYDKIFDGKSGLNVLDACCLYSESPIKRLLRPEVSKLIILSYNVNVVNKGNDEHKNGFVEYYNLDLNDTLFEKKLNEIIKQHNIKKFDVINISMALIDSKSPFKVLKNLRKFLVDGGQMFIRDLDDGVVYAYPDEKKLFKTYLEMLKDDKYAGFRYSGRQVYSHLKKVRASYISLEYAGINTSLMDYNSKGYMFATYFSFLGREYDRILQNEPNNQKIKKNLAWLDENLDDMEADFFDDDFIFNSGFFIYHVKF